MKSICIVTILLVAYITRNEALQCYSHSACSTNCPQLSKTVTTCRSDDNKCYKTAFPGGVIRGCANERCAVQVDAHSVLASVCCEKELCNLATTSTIAFSTLFMIISTSILI